MAMPVNSVKLSKPGKMPCYSWSLQAIDTCPGSRGADGELVAACRGCYATDGNYLFANVKATRAHNLEDWRRDDWAADMVQALAKQKYFRWFDSGDMYHLALAEKIFQVMKATPGCQHWLPTRMHKFKKFAPVLARMGRLENVAVRKSSDSITGGRIRGKNTSTIIAGEHQARGATICRAYENDGKCGDCRACWNKSIPVIAYVQHGRKMAKVNRDLIASTSEV